MLELLLWIAFQLDSITVRDYLRSIHNCHLAFSTYLNSTNRDYDYCHSRLVRGNENASYITKLLS